MNSKQESHFSDQICNQSKWCHLVLWKDIGQVRQLTGFDLPLTMFLVFAFYLIFHLLAYISFRHRLQLLPLCTSSGAFVVCNSLHEMPSLGLHLWRKRKHCCWNKNKLGQTLLPGPVDLGDVGACENDSDELDESKNEADSDVDPGEGVLYQVPLQHHLQDLDTPVFPDSNVVTPCLNGFVNLQYSFNDFFG